MAIFNEMLGGGINAKNCTATAADILIGKTAAVGKEIVTGSMANNGAVSKSLTTPAESYIVPEGYHNGSGKVSVNMTNNGAVNKSLTTQNASYTIPKGYHNGSGKVTASITNLTAANIKKGVSVGGVAGSYNGLSVAFGGINPGQYNYGDITITHGLGRIPTFFYIGRTSRSMGNSYDSSTIYDMIYCNINGIEFKSCVAANNTLRGTEAKTDYCRFTFDASTVRLYCDDYYFSFGENSYYWIAY